MLEYPSRPQLFALHYIRWLIDSSIVLDIGPSAFAMLVAVVTLEDELRYSRAPNFFNDQLARRSGIVSDHALIRARKVCVDAGLLEYSPGRKRCPGRYFVCGFTAESAPKAKPNSRETEGKPQPSTPSPNPSPIRVAPTFKKPTIEEITAYCSERKRGINPEQFFDFYEANGWTQGKGKPIRDWKAALRTWERNGFQRQAVKDEVPSRRFGEANP